MSATGWSNNWNQDNVDFDYDAIKSMGDEELEKIQEEIKDDEGVDWMFHS